jgi:hypothetical protein
MLDLSEKKRGGDVTFCAGYSMLRSSKNAF